MRTYLFIIVTIVVVLAVSAVGWGQGLDTTSALLPPDGDYVSPDQYHEYSAAGIILDDPVHRPIVSSAIREAIGTDEIETFNSVFTAKEIGQGLGPITLTGPVQVRTTNRMLSTAGLFDTEIVSMSLSGSVGPVPIIVRQDPARPSLGLTDIGDIGGGLYHIDSFFDVFTELSVDGGASWVPSDYSTRMTLVPEPCVLALLSLGAVGLLRKKR